MALSSKGFVGKGWLRSGAVPLTVMSARRSVLGMETNTERLINFVLARVAEDEEVASHGDGGLMDDAHFSRRRVLAECEARRRIVEELREHLADANHLGVFSQGQDDEVVAVRDVDEEGWDDGYEHGLTSALELLALPHADHPDYQEGWRP
jgi:hypothetical protein